MFLKNVISKRRSLYVTKHFSVIPMGAIRYSCSIRLVPTYILPAKDIRLLGEFQPDSFKTKTSLRRNGRTDGHGSNRLG